MNDDEQFIDGDKKHNQFIVCMPFKVSQKVIVINNYFEIEQKFIMYYGFV